ncbi:hypothetical protein TNCV_348181 [Trichonephila clavipes]|nr:hypothetical protein TNCV_348181 [Trichonephila clavipes]
MQDQQFVLTKMVRELQIEEMMQFGIRLAGVRHWILLHLVGLTMARKKSKSIQRKGQGTPVRILNPERPPSTSTESSRSISPLIDGTTRMTIDEPTDLDLPP